MKYCTLYEVPPAWHYYAALATNRYLEVTDVFLLPTSGKRALQVVPSVRRIRALIYNIARHSTGAFIRSPSK
jgi:hypothetical protein